MNMRSLLLIAMAVITCLMLCSGQSGATAPQHPQRGNNDGLANAYPSQIAAAPDGSVWFTENRGVEHLLPSGQFHLYTVPGADGVFNENTPDSLVVDAQGTVWFTSGPHLGRVDSVGNLSIISVPVRLGRPYDITKGLDGTLWCLFEDANSKLYRFARISPDGRVYPMFSWPSKGSIPGSVDQLDAFAIGKGDRLWVADTFVTNVTQGTGPSFAGYLDSHEKIVRIPLPNAIWGVCYTGQCTPSTLLIGKTGTAWIGLRGAAIEQVTTAGVQHVLVLPPSVMAVMGLASGEDGIVWYSTIGEGIGQVSRSGRSSFFEVSPNRTAAYEGITATPDGSLWFTIGCKNSIGHHTVTGVVIVFHIPGTIAEAEGTCPDLP
jgi:streptogramin lyase